jgi:hypothetical protein
VSNRCCSRARTFTRSCVTESVGCVCENRHGIDHPKVDACSGKARNLLGPNPVAGNLLGVIGVEDEIELIPPGPTAHDVEHSIKKAMERNAKLDAESVSVESSTGTITLRGTVSSWADHDQAIDAAWAAPGVTRVNDHILVAY